MIYNLMDQNYSMITVLWFFLFLFRHVAVEETKLILVYQCKYSKIKKKNVKYFNSQSF